MQKMIRAVALTLDIFLASLSAFAFQLQATLPDSYSIIPGETISFAYPIDMVYAESEAEAFTSAGGYKADLKLLGIIQLKTVDVSISERKTVYVSGAPFGIKMLTDGLMVVGMSDVPTGDTRINPAKSAGVAIGDMLEKADGVRLESNEHLGEIVAASQGRPITLDIRRDGKTMSVTVTPALSKGDGKYHMGVWVRDSSAGIGTMTFFDPNTGIFTGLGHPICDIDTGNVMPLIDGEVVAAEITGYKAGEPGAPGELKGRFMETAVLGGLVTNCQTGVYDVLSDRYSVYGVEMSVAAAGEVTAGDAQIYTTIDGTRPKAYSIRIEKVLASDNSKGQNLVIRVTDTELLAKTGGIVQGMSGSPIIQNGMLVGAVTHVFVNDPTRGYGIFVDNVLADMNSLLNSMNLSMKI